MASTAPAEAHHEVGPRESTAGDPASRSGSGCGGKATASGSYADHNRELSRLG